MGYPRSFAFLATATSFLAVLVLGPGCGKDGAPDVGKTCETGAVLQPGDAYLFPNAKECPTELCLKPIDHSVNHAVDTESFCTADCSNDGDCDGQLRDKANPADRRCITGFACAIPFDSGDKACKRMCVCKDFLAGGLATAPLKCAN